MFREILTAIGAMTMSFVIGVVAIVLAVAVTFWAASLCYGRIERNGVIVQQFNSVFVNDVYENDKHTLRQYVVLDREGWQDGEPKIIACLVTRLGSFVFKRGAYYNLLWLDSDNQVHLWRFKHVRNIRTNEYDLNQVYIRAANCQSLFAYDWQVGEGPTPARK